MKYQVGDKVRIKQWDAMEHEFGLDSGSDIPCTRCFTATMETEVRTHNRIVTISEASDLFDEYRVEEVRSYCFSDDMIESLAFKYGEEIEVRDEEDEKWVTKIFVGYSNYHFSPITCVSDAYEEEFKDKEKVNICPWNYARKLKKEDNKLEITILKNGEPINEPLSEETARNLGIIK